MRKPNKTNQLVRIYDGANFCGSCGSCPVVEYDKEGGQVVVKDPAKPVSGSFTMSVEEYNSLIKNAQPIG